MSFLTRFYLLHKKTYAALLTIFSTFCAHGYIGTIYHLYNPQFDQHVFLLGDRHEGKNCGGQQQHIIEAAQSLGATIIVEDMLMPFPDNEQQRLNFIPMSKDCHWKLALDDLLQDPLTFDPNKNYYSLDGWVAEHSETPLLNMTRACHRQSIPVVNVECRLAIEASVSGLPISGHMVRSIIKKYIDEIKQYNDGPELNQLYQQVIAGLENIFTHHPMTREIYAHSSTIFNHIESLSPSFLEFCKLILAEHQTRLLLAVSDADYGTQTLEDFHRQFERRMWPLLIVPNAISTLCKEIDAFGYCADLSELYQKTVQKVNALSPHELIFNLDFNFLLGLLDTRLVHQIYALRGQKNVIACAGLLHMYAVKKVLMQAGYKLVPEQCIGSTLSTCLRNPTCYYPVNIEQYFDNYCCNKFLATPHTVHHSCERLLLRRAIASGCTQIITSLINKTDSDGQTELIHAAQENDQHFTRELISHGAKTDIRDHKGVTALAWAINNDNIDLARILTQAMPRHEIDIADNDGDTPLHIAATCSDEYVIHDLINNGAKVNTANNDGTTALMYATSSSKSTPGAVRALLARGANPNAVDNDGFTALMHAALSKNTNSTSIIRYLCLRGATVDATRNGSSATALLYALWSNKVEATQELLKNGADIFKEAGGFNVMHMGLTNSTHPAITALMVEAVQEKVARDQRASRTCFI